MVRTKSLNASFGRKRRIEGIVMNLCAKSDSLLNKFDENRTEPISTSSGTYERSESLHKEDRGSLLRPDQCPVTDSMINVRSQNFQATYQLPENLQFYGVAASKQLFRGQTFGPFSGSISPTVDPSLLNYSYISQIPDVEGNDHCLNLYKEGFDSSKWLNCLERRTSDLAYNIVAYNTPRGIVLQTTCDTVAGQPLCIAYDKGFDITQTSRTSNENVQVPKKDLPSKTCNGESFVNLRIHGQQITSYDVDMTNHHDDNEMVGMEVNSDSSEDMKNAYNVMTADVSETYYPSNDDLRNSRSNDFTHIVSTEDKLNEDDSKKKTFKCSSCRSTFDTAEERHSHMETAHSAECPICKKVYTSSYLKEHMTFHNESSRVTCNICSKVFSSISNLRKHQKKHEKNGYPPIEKKRLYKCSECIETFLNEKDLEVHRSTHVGIVPIKCNDCGEVFAQKNMLRRHHAVVHKGIRPFSCNYCEKTFTQRGNLARHCKQAHSDKTAEDARNNKEKFVCRRRGCNQGSFSSRELYIQHIQEHSGNDRIYSCDDCSYVFSSSGNLSKHRKTFHGNCTMVKSSYVQNDTFEGHPTMSSMPTDGGDEEKYECTQCERVFQSEYQYTKHMSAHKNKKKDMNKCENCGKIFMTRSGLSKHLRYLRCVIKKEEMHLSTYENVDSVAVPSENLLQQDTSTLLREDRPQRTAKETTFVKDTNVDQPFSCSTCGENFTSAWYLKVHRRSHKNYHIPCELCGKMFSHVTNLNKHMRYIHQGAIIAQKEKDKSKETSDADQAAHVNGEDLTCEICNKTLANANSLAVHRQLHYGLKPFKCEFCDTRFTQKCNMKRHLGTCKIAKQFAQNSNKLETPSSEDNLSQTLGTTVTMV
ncbi:zinc finger protein 431-like isoform X2 [Xenia sp. Carnegie-2017]|uniref:zinc finger protein 431-like isoform X2 n=1 Tax=Xenia sp. Carnegie-2017 TaxID=2897299 RepID=UPI001F034464|nr:zinc finger protein 431-like isoform X2 [Xenia sp. Carnegie-2017]